MLLTGNLGQPIDLELVQQDGQIKREIIFRQKNESFFNARGDFHFEILDGNVGYLDIPTFNNPEILAYYEKVMPEIMKADALIIDIRKNGGGNGAYGHELMGYLTEKTFYQSINILRQYTAAQRAWGVFPDELKISNYDWKPYKGIHYDKPVTVLIGPSTYSAAEDFLVPFKSIDRGMLIGQTTGGSTGQPLFFELPNEGMGFVCSKRDLMTNGIDFVGKGIQPDIWVNYSLRNFLQGKDEAMEKAFQHLNVKKW